MKIDMTPEARDAARSLAICYEAFLQARRSWRPNEVVVWGESLIRAQERVGVQLQCPDNVQHLINHARLDVQKGES